MRFMDPLADKCLVVAAMLWFVEIGQMPAWAVLAVVIREFAVSGLRMVAADKEAGHRRRLVRKVKTASTIVVHRAHAHPPVAREIGSLCVAVIVLTTIYSGVEYFIKNLDVLSEQNRCIFHNSLYSNQRAPSVSNRRGFFTSPPQRKGI